jgi:hypothetical protein
MSDDQVLSVVDTLEKMCVQIESELQIINEDIAHTAECVRRYGDVYAGPLRYLCQLRDNKKLRFQELIGQLEALRTQLESSSQLVAALNKSQPVSFVHTL